ncbi:TIGR04282 family arsenosugar biosynthesis glycosyltransferase [Candidatus Mycalebacterium sp.]
MNTVAVFLKHPTPGKVKTRMAKDIGNGRAAEIYASMAETVMKNIGEKHSFCVFYDPPEMKNEIVRWLSGRATDFVAQKGETLGEKISNAIDDRVSAGNLKVVVIGTDCVDITAETITDSFERLDTADAVIGPCEDGGYYLIGLKTNRAELFSGIDWSTDRVMAQTLEKARKLRLNVSVLKTLRDIDCADDLNPQVMEKLNGRTAE